jgi:hypothetical protein
MRGDQVKATGGANRPKATTVFVSIINVAPFQRRHNARRTTLEWFERSSMRLELSTSLHSESQSEKGSGSVRVGGDASFLPAPGRTRRPGLGQRTYPPIPVEIGLRAGASQTLNEHRRVRSLGWKFPLKNEFATPCLAQSEC